jgi:hypothetical protein
MKPGGVVKVLLPATVANFVKITVAYLLQSVSPSLRLMEKEAFVQ